MSSDNKRGTGGKPGRGLVGGARQAGLFLTNLAGAASLSLGGAQAQPQQPPQPASRAPVAPVSPTSTSGSP